MRIISGIHKGKHIVAPSHFSLRPTTDMAKEGLFNTLGSMCDIEDSSVLDLFAGIGSISLECASRGASDIVSVERERKHASFIQSTAQKLHLPHIKVLTQDVRDFLKIAHREFDIIFADPPYDLPWIEKLADYIFASPVVGNYSTVIIEHPQTVTYTGNKNFVRLKKYGKVCFSFLELPHTLE